MKAIALSSDSTCDLDAQLKAQYDVHTMPLHIVLRDKDYIDNVTITPQSLYAAYEEDKSLPKTASVSPADYEMYFKQFTDMGQEVIHISLGSALSASFEAASAAAEHLSGVYVVDSANLSSGTGQLVIRAGRMIEAGMSASHIARELQDMRNRVHSSFLLTTMDYLAAGGRCPSIVAHVGKMMKFRPEILVSNKDGSMSLGKIYRGTMEKALPKYIADQLAQYGDDLLDDDIFITDTDSDTALADRAAELVAETHPFDRIHCTKACCTIASHCGPGTIGILFMTKH